LSVLSRIEIKRRLDLSVEEPQSIVITPLLDENFDHDAVDLRLGCYFRLPAMSSVPCITPYRQKAANGCADHYPELIHKPYRRDQGESPADNAERRSNGQSELILHPQHAVLASTLEYIKMPGDVSAEILTKSSWARLFISIASAPWIHPFYRGCLTLEITNLGNIPVALPIGKPIAQLVFMKLEPLPELTKDVIEGTYAGAVTPEAPRFRSG